MDNKCKNKRITLQRLLNVALVTLLIMVGLLIASYVKLQQAQPLENFSGRVISPIDLATDTILMTEGTFDRPVMCNMIGFKVFLTNQETGDIIVLTPKHLAASPTESMNPGKDIPINFSLHIPSTLVIGTHLPHFQGTYLCRLGIFMSRKVQSVRASSFTVIDSSK